MFSPEVRRLPQGGVPQRWLWFSSLALISNVAPNWPSGEEDADTPKLHPLPLFSVTAFASIHAPAEARAGAGFTE